MRPGRVASIIRFIKYVQGFEGTWIAKRSDIAAHFAIKFATDDTWNLDCLESVPKIEK